MSEREYDIVLFGATGFTGELTATYLAAHLPAGSRWALAGRSQAKLEAVRERLRDQRAAGEPGGVAGGGAGEAGEAADPAILIADTTDADSIARLATAARVVISTVGPYLRYGEPLVAACASAGTDYVDLTGEPEFVDLMYLRHHRAAVESGARIVHSCGFDSIPYDLGALYTVSQLPDDEPIALQGFGLMVGGFSGGTYQSLVEALGRIKESGRAARQRGSVERNSPEGRVAEGREVHGISGRPHREPLAGGWVVPAPTIDPQHVLRSARALPAYGPNFSYSHYLVTGTLPKAAALVGGVGAIGFLAQLPQTRRLALKLRSPGEGPSPERRAKSFFRVRFIADVGGGGGGGAGDDGGDDGGSPSTVTPRRFVTEVLGGDPGYGETSKMLAESAMALAFDGDALPSAGRGGQLTPAVAFGTRLIDRLSAAGITFRVVSG